MIKKTVQPIEDSRVIIHLEPKPEKDGIIYIRKGVKDLPMVDLYKAKCRILLKNSNFYIRGMAVLTDGESMTPGCDIETWVSAFYQTGYWNGLRPAGPKNHPFDIYTEPIEMENGRSSPLNFG